MLEVNEMKVLRKIVSKTKIHRIRSQQIRESFAIQTVIECMEWRKREWEEHVIRMNAEKLIKISKDNESPGRPRRRWSYLTLGYLYKIVSI